MSNYELTYILRPLEEANLTTTNERINTVVKNAGGEIVARNDWGRRRLAYPIRKINDGYYTTLYVTLPGTAVRGVERSLQLIDDVQRYLVVRVDEFKLPAQQPAGEGAAPSTAPIPGTTQPAAAQSAAAQPAAQAEATPVAQAEPQATPAAPAAETTTTAPSAEPTTTEGG